VGKHANHVVVSRLASNRTLFHPPVAASTKRQAHPTWHGARFKLNAPDTWGEADEETQVEWRSHKGRVWQVKLQRWNGLLMAGKRAAAMHQRPFDLIRCQAVNEEGKPVFKHALWLLVMGQRRREVSLLQVYEAYRQRYDLEHFFRFGKNHLLLDRYQTPEVEYEENWVELVCLAYIQLWLARSLAVSLPRPWERYLPERKEREVPGPTEVQRNLGRIIRQFGTPAQIPEPRGNSGGRSKGQSPGVRTRQPIIFKSRAPPQAAV
jgi:hypothetical protein